ncbi:MAG TPA: FKBP-type peptidyl-prolyl cis-trans isomerase, partial [Flavobacterium sp.]|nr:FKBP-type peptidyl-prolyl cis-trans isomerase [Flavobacterium sp.]
LRDGIKRMHKNETITFLFPSHSAYGYHGDNKKIGPNESLIVTVTLRNFVPDPAAQKTVPATQTPKNATPKPAVTKPAAIAKKDTLTQ